MKTNTSIVPIQGKTRNVVPKPTQTQIIEVMANQLIEQRMIENKRREIEREKIQVLLNKEIEKFKKRSIKLTTIPNARWENAGACVYFSGFSIPGSVKMQELSHKRQKLLPLETRAESVIWEVREKLKTETLTAILEQPGVKEAIKSSIAKLGL